MKKLIEQINRVSISGVELSEGDKLILKSAPRKVMSPLFIIGAIGFVLSSLLRGFLNWHIGELFLLIFTLILISGVWNLSAAGKVIFNKNEGKVFCVYRHLGYLQKVYAYNLASIDTVLTEKRNGNHLLFLIRDDRKKIWLAQEENDNAAIANTIKSFLSIH